MQMTESWWSYMINNIKDNAWDLKNETLMLEDVLILVVKVIERMCVL